MNALVNLVMKMPFVEIFREISLVLVKPATLVTEHIALVG
jgi:hypothetical protein